MADTYTAHLVATKQEIGAHDNTWGTILNDNFDLFDDKLGNVTTISGLTGGSTTLTADEERANVIRLTGTLVSNQTINFSGRGGTWLIENDLTVGAYTVTLKKSAQTGIAIDPGQTLVYFDGTDIAALSSNSVLGKHSIWVPAKAMTPRLTSGAERGLVETSTYDVMLSTLNFDPTTAEYAQFEIAMPASWDEGTITFKPYWSHAAASVNFGVVWGLSARAQSDGDAIDQAYGTEQTSTDTGGTTDDLFIGPESAAITIAGTPATGDLVIFSIRRDPTAVADTMSSADARLIGLMLYFTIDEPNDG